MSGTRPLIFVHPLSESLKKLLDVIKETAEEEGIEIFEVENSAEISQLLPTVGQSLTLFSNAKQCATCLQPNRKAIAKLNSKVILLSQKSIPRKTLDKFSKIGLTECIVEPVPPKTLLYKVKLLIRSIVISSDEEEQELEKKFSATDDAPTSTSEKQRVEKGMLLDNDENTIDMNMKDKFGSSLEEISNEDEAHKSEYKENAIKKDWKGAISRDELLLEDTDEDKKDSDDHHAENYIDSYLRGKKTSTDMDFDLDDDNMVAKKTEQSYEFEEDEIAKKSALKKLLLEEEAAKQKEKSDVINDDTHYKGKIGKTLNLKLDDDDDENTKNDESLLEIDEDLVARKKEIKINLEHDKEAKSEDDELDFEDDFKKKKKAELNLNLESSNDDKNSKEELNLELDEDIEKRKKEAELNLEVDDETNSKKDKATSLLLDEDEDENENDSEQKQAIDKYLRGKASNTTELLLEEEIDARNHAELNLDGEDDDKNSRKKETTLKLDTDNEKGAKSNNTKLNLEEHLPEDEDDANLDIDGDEEAKRRRKEININLEQDNNKNNDDEGYNPLDDDNDNLVKSKKDIKINLEAEDKQKEDGLDFEDEDDNYNRKKFGKGLTLEEEEKKKNNAFTEHINTNYDSRKAIKHQEEYDWDNLNKKEKDETIGLEKKAKSQMEISFKEKVDLGEQTIDYRKLHSEFDAITINRVGNKRKKTGPKYYGADDDDLEYLQSIYGDDWEEALAEMKEKSEEKFKKEEEVIVYEPNACGIDEAIRVMNLYHNKSITKEDIFSFISYSILKKYNGHTFFFAFNTTNNDYTNAFKFNENDEGVDISIIQNWPELKEQYWNDWLKANLPFWLDHTYQADSNWFFYPIYEGANKLGFAIVNFNKKIDQKIVKPIEAILETSRGIVLDDYHKKGVTEKDSDNKQTEGKKEQGGLLKSIFGRFGKKAS